MTLLRSYPIIGAVIAQLLAAMVMLALRTGFAGVLDPELLAWLGLAAQCLAAAAFTHLFGLPVWWVWIGLVFPLAVALVLAIENLPGWPFGVVFVVLYLFFSNASGERVPLYLSNRRTAEALVSLLQQRGGTRFIDLGSGLGGVVRALDGQGRTSRGVETAPMVWLLSVVLSRLTGRGRILRQDMWSTDIGQEDVVYAFLSSEPMPALYKKAKGEMKPGSLLVSNSFPVPGVEPTEIWKLPDRRKTQLYLYLMAGSEHAKKANSKRSKKSDKTKS